MVRRQKSAAAASRIFPESNQHAVYFEHIMNRTLIGELSSKIGETVTTKGWVHVYRDQGKMAFLDIRDRSGLVQAVVLPKSPALETAKQLRAEWVVAITGNVNLRPEKDQKPDVVNGTVELEVLEITVINQAE